MDKGFDYSRFFRSSSPFLDPIWGPVPGLNEKELREWQENQPSADSHWEEGMKKGKLFSLLLGGALQLTNMYGDVFLDHFKEIPIYADSFAVKYSTIIMSISQISETLFILAIPFFLYRFGIKKVMLISMIAWVLRFGLLAYANPADGLWMIIISCIVYGMAFDFFNISGSLFVDSTVDPSTRSSAQGLFMMMTNGFGAILGSLASGYLIDHYFLFSDGSKDWNVICEVWVL